MEPANSPFEVIRFATYEVNVQAGELRKSGVKLRLGEQPFRLLVSLLERPGQVVTRNELQKRLWPDTFVDVDAGLNAAVNKVREALSDSADNPRFVETVARRGYRFIAPLETPGPPAQPKTLPTAGFREVSVTTRGRLPMLAAVVAIIAAVVAVGSFLLKRKAAAPSLHSLTRLTFDDGLQIGATWSPDGRYIAYASDRGGKFDIWVQQVEWRHTNSSNEWARKPLAAGLVQRWEIHRLSVRGRRRRIVRNTGSGRGRASGFVIRILPFLVSGQFSNPVSHSSIDAGFD